MPYDSEMFIAAGRILLGGAFLVAGLRNTRNVGVLADLMKARGVPFARLAALIGVGIELVAGALLAAGIWIVPSAAALILFLVVATPIFHNFWDHQGLERANHVNSAIVNVALMGGFVMVLASSA